MKRIYLLLMLMLLVFCVVSCNNTTDETTSDEVKETTGEATTDGGDPTLEYVYSVSEIGSALPSAAETAGDTDEYYRFALPELSENLYVYKRTTGAPSTTRFKFYEEECALFCTGGRINFPYFPKEYGAYGFCSGDSSEPTRTSMVYIRLETETPVYIHEIYYEMADRVFFPELDMSDREAVVAFATDYLKGYADLEGFTLSVYEDFAGVDVNATDGDYGPIDGLAIEYNLMLGEYKTDCYAKMVIAHDKTAYTVFLTHEMKEAFIPYLSARVDTEQIDAIVSQRIEEAIALNAEKHRYDGYDSETVLMVIDGELKAYVTVEPRITLLGTEKAVDCNPICLLIDIAKKS